MSDAAPASEGDAPRPRPRQPPDAPAYPALRPERTLSVAAAAFRAGRFLCRLAAVLFLDFRVHGLAHVPRRGGVLLAANHQSFLDPVVAGIGLRRVVAFLARDTLFRVPLLGRILPQLYTVPVARESAAPREGLEAALSVLRAGFPLVLFPEGTRSSDGRLGTLKRGIQIIARRSGCPVVPVWVDGSFDAWPRQRRLPAARAVRVFIGPPIPFFPAAPADKEGGVSRSDVHNGPASGPGAAAMDAASMSMADRGRESSGDLLRALQEAYRGLQAQADKVRRADREAGGFVAPAIIDIRVERTERAERDTPKTETSS